MTAGIPIGYRGQLPPGGPVKRLWINGNHICNDSNYLVWFVGVFEDGVCVSDYVFPNNNTSRTGLYSGGGEWEIREIKSEIPSRGLIGFSAYAEGLIMAQNLGRELDR